MSGLHDGKASLIIIHTDNIFILILIIRLSDYFRFFSTMEEDIIPVVVDAHGHHAKAAPPHSFINILDFPSIRHLANYLILLHNNDTLYNQYFWWKSYFRVRNADLAEGLHYRTFCSLCAALHDPTRHSNQPQNGNDQGYYTNLWKWWKEKSRCRSDLSFDGVYTIARKNEMNPAAFERNGDPPEICQNNKLIDDV